MLVLNCSNYNTVIICLSVALFIILLYSITTYLYSSTGTVELDSSMGILFYHHDKNKERPYHYHFSFLAARCHMLKLDTTCVM